MSRSVFIALCISMLILGGFALFSQNYRAGVEQSANQAPVVASAAVPTDSPLDAPNVEASFSTTPPSIPHSGWSTGGSSTFGTAGQSGSRSVN